MVGWPPVRSFRRNALRSCTYVKVAVDGAPYLRKVDLEAHGGYEQLLAALEEMFSCFTVRTSPYSCSPDSSKRLPRFFRPYNGLVLLAYRGRPLSGREEAGGSRERDGVRPYLRGQGRRLDARRGCPLEVSFFLSSFLTVAAVRFNMFRV